MGELELAVEERGEAFGRHSVAGFEEVVLDMKGFEGPLGTNVLAILTVRKSTENGGV